uniref:DDE Tnp4 domain-containing protein n=1 Tax=Oreochromis niloticus TaxID=8128 RepID=A0A669BQ69_ORENI
MYIVINIFGIALLYLSIFFTGADLKPAFRLSRPSINMLVQMLLREKQHSWNSKIEVPVTIYCLACGASYRVTADIFSMPVATVCRIVHSVIEEMMTILHRVIHFPKAEEMEEVGAGFARLAGNEAFRCTAGAIDGCHIRILPPGEPHKRSYINRKLFPSIVLQGICDSRSTFLDVYIGNSGSVHDARVLRRSSMYKQALYPPAGFFLLGDGGYPSLQHPVAIMTPYHQPVSTQVEESFNRHHAKARIIIERTFGILKTRWRSIFLRALDIQPLFAPKVVGACCILHNICVATNDVHQEEGQEAQPGLEAETEGTEFSFYGQASQIVTGIALPFQWLPSPSLPP